MRSEHNHSHFTTTITYTPKSQLFWLFKHSSYTTHVLAHTVGVINIDAETEIDALLTVWGHNNQRENHSIVELRFRPHTNTYAWIILMSSILIMHNTHHSQTEIRVLNEHDNHNINTHPIPSSRSGFWSSVNSTQTSIGIFVGQLFHWSCQNVLYVFI